MNEGGSLAEAEQVFFHRTRGSEFDLFQEEMVTSKGIGQNLLSHPQENFEAVTPYN